MIRLFLLGWFCPVLALAQSTAGIEDLLAAGAQKEKKGDYAGAITDYDQALRRKPNAAAALYHRGVAEIGASRFAAARADLTKAIDAEPVNSTAYFMRGLAEGSGKDYTAASRDFTEALRLNPKFFQALTARGDAFQDQDDLDDAIQDYNAALVIEPKSPGALTGRARAWARKGEFARAIQDNTEVLKANPRHTVALKYRAYDYLLSDRYAEARVDLGQLVVLEPANADYHELMADISNLLGDYAAAVPEYQRAAWLGSANDYAKLNLYVLQWRLGNRPKPAGAAPAAGPDTWVSRLWDLLGARVGADDLSALLEQQAAGDTRYEQRKCSLNYYAGMIELIHGNKDTARAYFEKSLAANAALTEEYHFAKAELARLGR